MAGTYGEPGKNTFAVSGVGGILSTVVNDTSGVAQIYRSDALGSFKSLGTYNPSTNKFTPDSSSGLSASENKALSDNVSIIKDAAKDTTKIGIIAAGGTAAAADATTNKLFAATPAAPTPPGSPPDPTAVSFASAATTGLSVAKISSKSRPEYRKDLSYPRDRKKHSSPGQDYIKFDIRTYEAVSTTVRSFARSRGSIIGTITLPIQPSITDDNSVQWGEDTLDPIQRAGAAIAMRTFNSSYQNAGQEFMMGVGDAIKEFSSQKEDVETAIKAYFAGAAVGNQNLLSRLSGAVLNPNLELLFQRPNLRTFNYNFRLTPRGKDEAEEIKQIIRAFKQSMAVQRSDQYLFLKAPNVYGITYIYGGTDLRGESEHQYLPLVKDSALIRCSVDYTPDQSYMTYENGSMTSYNLTLSFQELTPVYNDEYPDDKDQSIGY